MGKDKQFLDMIRFYIFVIFLYVFEFVKVCYQGSQVLIIIGNYYELEINGLLMEFYICILLDFLSLVSKSFVYFVK